MARAAAVQVDDRRLENLDLSGNQLTSCYSPNYFPGTDSPLGTFSRRRPCPRLRPPRAPRPPASGLRSPTLSSPRLHLSCTTWGVDRGYRPGRGRRRHPNQPAPAAAATPQGREREPPSRKRPFAERPSQPWLELPCHPQDGSNETVQRHNSVVGPSPRHGLNPLLRTCC